MSTDLVTPLSHWADHAVELQWREYEQQAGYKPNGFWFDVDEDWRRWCDSENYRTEDYQLRHPVTIADWSKVLHLSTPEALDDFTVKFYVHPVYLRGYNRTLRDGHINWPRVARQYSGIIITPYQWERRLTLLWYYGWDCASGCVWDTSVIELGTPERIEAREQLAD